MRRGDGRAGSAVPQAPRRGRGEGAGPPAAPKPASCRGPWGHRVQMAERGPVSLICGAPGPRNTAPGVEVAPYGQTGRWGGISCSSTPQGLDCRNGSGHGFRLSRASQQVW